MPAQDRGSKGAASAEFWLERWRTNNIGFHLSGANPILVDHFADLSVPAGGRVCVPLCGKTRDIGWLLSQGRRVVGIELSEIAIGQLFEDLGMDAEVEETGKVKIFRAPGVEILCSDIFDVDRAILGPVDAIFDRAALTALPPEMRDRYAPHLVEITAAAPQLLITYLYDQAQMDGPPFATAEADIHRLYGPHYDIALLQEGQLIDGLRAARDVVEQVWLLKPRP